MDTVFIILNDYSYFIKNIKEHSYYLIFVNFHILCKVSSDLTFVVDLTL